MFSNIFDIMVEYILWFDMVKINIGNGYYLVIGVFIVLVIGVYVFMWIIWEDVYNYYII